MDLDTLLADALALVSEDRRGQLADLIEQIITQARAAPQKVCLLMVGGDPATVVGVYASLDALRAEAKRMGIRDADIGELVVKRQEAANG